jgi:outer membrane biosynthesis protein TonB
MLHRFTLNLIGVFFVCLVLCVSPALFARSAIGIKASGKSVTPASEHKSPRMEDIIKGVPPEYPYNDRRNYHQGKGLYRVTVDRKTGSVTNVTVIKSTG